MIFNLMKPVPVQAETATMYSYNGTVLPALPEWDKEKYPYVAISNNYGVVYAMSEKSTYTPGIMMSTWKAPAPYMTAEIDLYGNITEWKQHDTDGSITIGAFWSNHDIMNTEDGTVKLSASEPVPVTLPITMYDGEVKTELDSWQDPTDYRSAATTIQLKCGYKIGDTLEITLDGHTETYTATTADTYGGVLVGNNGLNGNDVDGVDDGGDILLTYPSCFNGKWSSYIYTRTAGTHQLKIVLLKG